MAKYYRFDLHGNVLVDKTFDEITQRFGKLNEYVFVRKGKKWGVANYETLELIIQLEYDRIEKDLFEKSERLMVWQGDQFSIIDIDNNVLIPPGYDFLNFDNKNQELGRAGLGGKVGVINKKGEIIIEPKYLDCEILSDNRILIKDLNEFFLSDKNGVQISNRIKGDKVVKLSYKEGNNWAYKYFLFANNGKYGILDFDFNIILECKYDNAIKLINSNCFFTLLDGTNYLINYENIVLKKFDFSFEFGSEQFLNNGKFNYIIRKDKTYGAKCGILDQNFNLVLPIEYDWIDYSNGFWTVRKGRSEYLLGDNYTIIENSKHKTIGKFEKEEIACVQDENLKYNFIDKNGNPIFEKSFDSVLLGSRSLLDFLFQNIKSNYKSGLCGVCIDSKWGYVDLIGKLKIECKYDEITEFDKSGFAVVKFNSKWGVIDNEENVLIDFKYDSILDFNVDLKLIVSKKDDQLGVIDYDENEIIPFSFSNLFFDGANLISGFSKKPIPRKLPIVKQIEPIKLLDFKFLEKHNNLIHDDLIRIFVLALVSGKEDNLSNHLYIVDIVNKDTKTATFISGYSGGGTWDEQTFLNNELYNGKKGGFTVFDFIRDDEAIRNLVAEHVCHVDEELDEYKYKSLKNFKNVGNEDLKLLYSVWYNDAIDYTEIAKNDKKRLSKLLKLTGGIKYSNWNFEI